MGRCRSMGFLKSFLSCASQLFEASILVFLISHMPPSSSALRLRVGGWWHLLNRRHCFLFREPSFTFGSPKTLMAVTCLFTDVAGNVSFTVPLYGWKFNHMWETFHDFFFFFCPATLEGRLRSKESSCWYVAPGVNLQIRPIDRQ